MPHRRARPVVPFWSILLLVGGAAGGCRKEPNAYVPPPPPEVTVARPVQRTVPDTLEFSGTTRGLETVEVRARVKGFIQDKHVLGGERVKAGDLLFIIDPREYEAAVWRAQAEAAGRQSALTIAELTLGRVRAAQASEAANQQEVDTAVAQRDAAKAQLDLAQAAVYAARLDLGFTQVTAPTNGRLGMVYVEPGQLVGANESTLLGTVINDDEVYATYDIDERQVLALRRANANRRPGEDGRPDLPVRLGTADEVGFPHVGRFSKADNTVDPLTGTIRVESVFPNPDGSILPGLYVRVRVLLGERSAMLVPDIAVGSDARGRYVLVVNGEGVVERRGVTAGPAADRMRRIDEGLEPDARVVVNGMQRARPGTKVTAVEAEPGSGPAGAAPAPGPAPAPGASAPADPPAPGPGQPSASPVSAPADPATAGPR